MIRALKQLKTSSICNAIFSDKVEINRNIIMCLPTIHDYDTNFILDLSTYLANVFENVTTSKMHKFFIQTEHAEAFNLHSS